MYERFATSRAGLAIGGAIGLAVGVLLNYLIQFHLHYVHLPWSGPSLSQVPAVVWSLPIVIATTLLGALYYASDS